MTPQKIKYLDIVYLYMIVLRNAITTAALSLKPFNMQPYRLKIAHPIYLKYYTQPTRTCSDPTSETTDAKSLVFEHANTWWTSSNCAQLSLTTESHDHVKPVSITNVSFCLVW